MSSRMSSDEFKGDAPEPYDNETYKEFYERVCLAKEAGFHLGDLSQENWIIYCDAQGYNGVDVNSIINNE